MSAELNMTGEASADVEFRAPVVCAIGGGPRGAKWPSPDIEARRRIVLETKTVALLGASANESRASYFAATTRSIFGTKSAAQSSIAPIQRLAATASAVK